MSKDSISWFLITGLIILFNINKAEANKNYFLDIIKDSLKFTILLEFVVNIYNFSLLGELFFIPTIVIISVLLGISSTKSKYKIVENFFSVILSFIGIALFILSVVQIVTKIQTYLNYYTLRLFLLPIILSISFIPFVYLLSVYMNYEMLLVRLKFFLSDYKILKYARLRSLLKCNLRLNKIKLLMPLIMKEFYSGINKDEIKNIIK